MHLNVGKCKTCLRYIYISDICWSKPSVILRLSLTTRIEIFLFMSHRPRQAKTSQSKPRQAQASPGKPRQAKASQGKPRQAKASQGKPRQAKASPGKPRQAQASQGKSRQAQASILLRYLWVTAANDLPK